jgi:hypothetical protein
MSRCRARLLTAVLLLLAAPACAFRAYPDEEVSGITPVYRRAVRGEEVETHVLYPLFQRYRAPGEGHTRLVPLVWDRWTDDGEREYDRDWAVFPLLFGGTDDREGGYFLLFPLYGTLKGVLAKDRIDLVAFPLYVGTRMEDYRTTNLLWPLVSWGTGEGERHVRVLPLYSRQSEDGVREKTTVLWPLVSWGAEDLDTDHPSRFTMVLPFYVHKSSDVAWAWGVLWPFFSFAGNEEGFSEANVLWPVYRRVRAGQDRYLMRVWPFFGTRRDGTQATQFWLWPLFWRRVYDVPDGWVRSFTFVPFFRRTELFDPEGGDRGAEVQAWPFFRTERTPGEWRSLFPVLLPFAGWDEFEANWRWLWTLLEVGATEDTSRVRVLSGLFGWEEGAGGTTLRLFWVLTIPL